MWRPRGPGGRFFPHWEIDNLDGWEELAPSTSVEKEIHLKLPEKAESPHRKATFHGLESGKEAYWLRYDENTVLAWYKMDFGIIRLGSMEHWR